MTPSIPPCMHPPVPAHIVAFHSVPGRTARRPYATIVMSVDARGKVTRARVDDSSGDPAWDAQAVQSARRWTFAPAEVDCKNVAGTAEFAVGTGPDVTFADPCEHDADVHGRAAPSFPKSALAAHVNGTTIVQIALDEAGRVKDAAFVQSSGTIVQDRAAYAAALTSTYVPPVHACRPIDGGYWFKVTYSGLKQTP